MHSKNLLAVLLIVSVIISIVGTIAAINTLGTYKVAPVKQVDQSGATGKVSVFVPPQPVDTTGKVLVNVVPYNEGG